MPAINHAQFIKDLYDRFPRIRAEIDPDIEGGLLHLEMAAFKRLTVEAIEAKDRDSLIQLYQFADRLLADGDDAVENAVYVSYLEHLEFEKKEELWAAELLTARLHRGWIDIQTYNDSIHGTNVAARLKNVSHWSSNPKTAASSLKRRSRDSRS